MATESGEAGANGRSRETQPLVAELAYVHELLAGTAGVRTGVSALPGLERLAVCHHLTAFDRDLLLVAAAPNVARASARHFELTDGDPRPSVGLVLGALGNATGLSRELVLARLMRGAPLLVNGLVEVAGDAPFTARRLVVPDAVWQRMIGLLPAPLPIHEPLAATKLVLSPSLERAIRDADASLAHRPGILAIRGPAGSGRTTIARALGHRLVEVGRTTPVELVVREARWHGAVPVIAGARDDLDELLLHLPALICVLEPADRLPLDVVDRTRELVVGRPQRDDRVALWQGHVGQGVDVRAAADTYRFGPARIAAAARTAVAVAAARGNAVTPSDLLDACRRVTPAAVSRLAPPLAADVSLADLVVPSAIRRELELAIAWSRHPNSNGPTCLFTGASGTGKTTAARAIAHAIGLPIHRVDLAQLVDKYIGETEKNLDRLFDEAEAANLILFFDEADALFAKRTEVRTAHDRFANVESGFLLQRLESHPGIVILATNLQRNFDEAFMRRIPIIVEFPLPDARERAALWELMLPHERDAVDVPRLAVFSLTGGDIRNAVATATVLAAAERVPLAMRHAIIAIWREMQRSGRLGRGNEFAAWQRELAPWLPAHPSTSHARG